MAPLRIVGIVSCVLILISLFLNWAWYPDLEKYFTAFYTENNYYGKPGKLLLFFALSGILFYWLNKAWAQRLNLIFGALCMAFAIRCYLLYTSSYDGYTPAVQAGIFIMLSGCLGHLVASMSGMVIKKRPAEEKTGDLETRGG